jgi:flagellar FliJ protein
MPRAFRFRLENVLRYRKLIEEIKEKELASIRAQIHRQKQKIELLEKEHTNIINELKLMKQKTFDLSAVRIYQSYLSFLKRRIMYEKDVLALLYQKEKKKLEEYIEARKNTRVLERLKERRFAQWQYEVDREEQKFLDDIGAILFLKEQRNG